MPHSRTPEPPRQRPAFDKRIKDTRAALRKVRELKRQGL